MLTLDIIESRAGRLVGDADVAVRPMPTAGTASVLPGDVLFGKLRPYLAKSLLVEQASYASTELLAIRPNRQLDAGYLSYVVRSEQFIDWTVATSEGTKMPRTGWEKVGGFRLRLPRLEEQRAIADFLDTETARIDALITKKRRLIELVDERFRAYRSTELLRGFNPVRGTAALPSGWSNVSLGVCIQLQRGHDLPDQDREPGDNPIVSSGGVSGWHSRAAAQGPGVVTGRYGTIGEVHFMEGPYWPLNTTLYVKDFRSNDPRWVFHLLAVLPLDSESSKSAVTGINRNVIGMLRVPLPPVEVQQSIARLVDEASHRALGVKGPLIRQIELLVEHRQALVTAAVTGQLSIPAVAA